MKQENLKLRVELHRRKAKEVEFEKKINNLKDQLRQVEEDNKVLREFNNIFGQENERLSAELKRYQQHQISRSSQVLTERPSKRIKAKTSPERSPEERNASEARVRIVLQKNSI